MNDVQAMYQQIILDHSRAPQYAELAETFDVEVHHVNPTCGDEITLRLRVVDAADPQLAETTYDAEGCSISVAAASVMAELVHDQPWSVAAARLEAFLELMQSKGQGEPEEDILGDGVAFAGVAKFPARVKCALLPWMALKDAFAQSQVNSTPAVPTDGGGEPQ